jgi:hypothetical protein
VEDLKFGIMEDLGIKNIISSQLRLDYEDEDFGDFVVLKKFAELPEKAKILVTHVVTCSHPWSLSTGAVESPGWVVKGLFFLLC